MYNRGNTARSYDKTVLTFMTFDEFEDIRERVEARRCRRLNKDRAKRARYYQRQRKMGMSILLLGVAVLVVACFIQAAIMAYFGGVFGLVGLYVILTKKMVLIDRYYFERQDRMNEY